ncbi:MAG: FtsX-like permease family protein [Chloroflexota bacterium]
MIEAEGAASQFHEIVTEDEIFDVSIRAYDDVSEVTLNRIEIEDGVYPGRNEVILERSYLDTLGIELGDVVTIEIDDERTYQLPVVGTVHDVNQQPGFVSDIVPAYTSTRTLHWMGLSADYNTLYLQVDRQSIGDLSEFTDGIVDDLESLGVVVTGITVEEITEHWAADNIGGIIAILIAIGSLALILSGFLVVNTISGLLAQQQKQIGIMKIIGASRGQIIAVYIAMVAVFGVLAALIALPLSSVLGRTIANFLGDFLNFDIDVFRLPVFIIITQIVVALLAPLIAALVPVLSGTGVSAAEAISDYNPVTSNNPIDILLAKLSGLPTPALLSIRNTFRRKMRLLMTTITLILAGAVFIAIINVRNSVQDDVAQLVQMSGFDIGFTLDGYYNSDGVQRRMQEVEGVVETEGWLNVPVTRVRPGDIEGEGFTLSGVPHDSIFIQPDIKEGVWFSEPDDTNRYDLVITDTLIDSEPDLEVGDTIVLNHNGDEQTWTIIGIAWGNNAPGTTGAIIYSYYDSVERFSGLVNQTNQIGVGAAQASVDYLTQLELRAFETLERYDIEVASTDILLDRLNSILNAFDVIITLLIVSAVMIAIVGGLGLAGTMSLSVLERTREIGVMRSVGASTTALRLMFIAEGTIIGLISAFIGLIISFGATWVFGYVLGMVIRERPWSYTLTLTGPLYWLIIVLVVSAIASVLPAQNATQISIREAISYE